MNERVVLLAGGGHGSVAADALAAAGERLAGIAPVQQNVRPLYTHAQASGKHAASVEGNKIVAAGVAVIRDVAEAAWVVGNPAAPKKKDKQ